MRGHNSLFIDPYDNAVFDEGAPGQWEPPRRAAGETRRLADRVGLAAMAPREERASTRYCLARPGVGYITFLPESGGVSVDLSGANGTFRAEWIHPTEGTITKGEPVAGGGKQSVKSPLAGPAVLYLRKR